MILLEIIIVLCLIVANGALALSELAIVSSRRPRLQLLADQGNAGAQVALALIADTGRFLSTAQIGITLIGVLAGAFSGATLAIHLSAALQHLGMPIGAAEAVALFVVVGTITYVSLIVGELIPKQLALRNPEKIACIIARPMSALSRFAAPLVALLDTSTKIGLRLFGGSVSQSTEVTKEEIRSLVAEADIVEPEEKQMINSVMRLGDRPIRALLTHRRDVDWIDLQAPAATTLERAKNTRRASLVVARGALDHVVGVCRTQEILAAFLHGQQPNIASLVAAAPFVPDSTSALSVLRLLKEQPIAVALVIDEHGGFEGIVTPNDLLGAIAGHFPDEDDGHPLVHRPDGSWLVSSWVLLEDLAEFVGTRFESSPEARTVAALVLTQLGELPIPGQFVDVQGYRFEVVDMDGRRIDKVLVTQLEREAVSETAS